MKFRRTTMLALLGAGLAFAILPLPVQSAARHPAVPVPDSTVVPALWVNSGVSTNFDSRIYNGDYYIQIDDLSRVGSAQLRWQSVSQQACLSRNTGLVCFNWDRQQVYMNGAIVRPNYKIRFDQGQLYIPMQFVTSKAFASFTGQEYSWNTQLKRLTQEAPVSVMIPPIQNLEDRYQLAMEVKSSVGYHMLENSKKRIWIRFVRGQTEGSQVLEGDNIIKEIRISQKRHSADLMIDLGAGALSHEVYFDKGSQRLTVDVYKEGPVLAAPVPEKEIEPEPAPREVPAIPAFPKFEQAPSASLPAARVAASNPVVREKPRPVLSGPTDPKVWTVVIDAGHGGMDPGAIGTRGTFEKDVNLKVAKELGEVLEKNKNYRVVLTREKDEFLTLSERTNIANKVQADVFVSVHCNSSLSSKHSGFEVYILSPEATDQAAAAVARVENSVVSLEAKKGDNSSRLGELLASMAVYNTINESSRFATYVCRGIKKRSSVDKTEVKEANFHVLRGAQMPGVLVELGYLSHPYSELQLRSSRYVNQLAKGLAEGVLMYQQSLGHKKQSNISQFNKPIKKASR